MIEEITLEGIIVPLDWDESIDEIITVGLETWNDVTYIVDDEEMTEELEAYLNKPLKLKGYVWSDDNGEMFIDVTSYSFNSDDSEESLDADYSSDYDNDSNELRSGKLDINEEYFLDEFYL